MRTSKLRVNPYSNLGLLLIFFVKNNMLFCVSAIVKPNSSASLVGVLLIYICCDNPKYKINISNNGYSIVSSHLTKNARKKISKYN